MFHRFSINYIGQMPSVSHFLKLLLLPLLALLLGAGGSKAQITIAKWTFENQNVIADATSIAANQSAKLCRLLVLAATQPQFSQPTPVPVPADFALQPLNGILTLETINIGRYKSPL
jgi:hypothetical protein